MKYQELGKGIIKRKEKRALGLFIDGTGLDRATRRLKRKVELSKLVRGVSSGLIPSVARYYTLIPYEDDSRQHAFLDAVTRAGLDVIVKRLPPKGVTRQVSIDVEMAADIIAFALGHDDFSSLSRYESLESAANTSHHEQRRMPSENDDQEPENSSSKKNAPPVKRLITAVCPSRDISYALALATELEAETTNCDFGQFSGKDVLKSASRWIDLSDSETIWRD